MQVVALLVLLGMLAATAWSWWRAPAKAMADQFVAIWRITWGKQLMLDFFGLEVILALWMLADASTRGSWIPALACIVALPPFGAMAAALYWLIR